MNGFIKRTISVLMIIVIVLGSIPVLGYGVEAPDNEVNFESSSSVGNVISKTFEKANSQTNETSDHGFNNVTLENNVVCVDLFTNSESTILLAVYNEETNIMIYSDKLLANSETNKYYFDVSLVDLPENYYFKVFMLGKNNEPLCTQYEYLYNTKKYQEFFSKTVDDFKKEYVVQFNEEKENNFLVVSSEAVLINKSDSNNILLSSNYEKGIYVFGNIDDNIRKLKEDDVLYYSSDDVDDIIVLKVGNVKIDGDRATVKQKETELSDVFEYVKLDSESVVDKSTYEKAVLGEGVVLYDAPAVYSLRRGLEYEGRESHWQGLDIAYENDLENISVNGKGGISLEVSANIYYDVELFGKDYINVSLETSVELELSVTLTATGDISKALDLAFIDELPVPLFAGIDAIFSFAPVIEFSASLTLAINSSYTFGFQYETDVKCKKISSCYVEPNFNIEGNLELKLGLKATVGIELVKSLSIELSFEGGNKFEGNVELYSESSIEKEEDVVHKCKACLVGTGQKFFAVELELEAGWDEINCSCTLVSKKWEKEFGISTPFYYSLSEPGLWGWGECPNKDYRIFVKVVNQYGEPVENSAVYFKYYTDENGEVEFYLDSDSIITVTHPDYQICDLDIIIDTDSLNRYFICLKDIEDNSSSDVQNIVDSGSCGENLGWILYDNGELEIYGLGEMISYDTAESYPWKIYSDTIRKVTIRSGVTTIGNYAFGTNYSSLEYVNLGTSIKTIGEYAFNNSNLKTIIIPDSVNQICFSAFKNCNDMKSVIIGDGLKSVNNVFEGCGIERLHLGKKVSYISINEWENLNQISVDNQNSCFVVDKFGVLYNCDMTELIKVPAKSDFNDYIIPDSVKTIGYLSFYNCKDLVDITIPYSVNYIGTNAFLCCSSLKTVNYQGSDQNWKSITISLGNENLTSANIICNASGDNHDMHYKDDGKNTIAIQRKGNALTPYFELNGKVAFCISPNAIRPGNGVSYTYGYEAKIPEIEAAVVAAENYDGELDMDIVWRVLQFVIWSKFDSTANYRGKILSLIGYEEQVLFDEFNNATMNENFTCKFFIYDTSESPKAGVYQTMATFEVNPVEEELIPEPEIPELINYTVNYFLDNELIDTVNCVQDEIYIFNNLPEVKDGYEYTETLETATIGNNYTMYVVEKFPTVDLLSFENLIYVDQKIAKNTNLSFDFTLREPYDDYKVVFVGQKNKETGHEHKYNYEWLLLKNCSCTEFGVLENTCILCGEVIYKNISATGHTWKDATCTTAKTCSACGTTEGTTLNHKDDNGDYKCDYNCGYEYEKPVTEPSTTAPTQPSTEHTTKTQVETTAKPVESTTNKAEDSTTQPSTEPITTVPVTEPSTTPAESITKPVVDSTTQPPTVPSTEPTTKAPVENTTQPTTQPSTAPSIEFTTKAPVEITTKPAETTKPSTESTTKPSTEPITKPSEESTTKPSEEPTTNHTHKIVVLPAVKPTYKKSGKTEGKKCSECGTILAAQRTVARKKLKKVTSLKKKSVKLASGSKTTLTLSWKKVTGAEKYVVQQYVNKKWKTVASTKKTYYTVKKLKANKSYKFRVRAKAGKYYGSYSKTYTAKTVPLKPTVKVKAGKKQLTASWKTVANITGYEVQYSTSKKFTKKTTQKVTIKKAKTKKTSIKKLKKGKKYFVKVRAYKTVGKKKIYGAWSTVKTVKVK